VWGDLEWWLSPAGAYLRGLHDGAALLRAELDAQDEAAHRAAVRAALRHIRYAEHRAGA